MRRVLRAKMEIADGPQKFVTRGPVRILHVAPGRQNEPRGVDVWFEDDSTGSDAEFLLTLVGTGMDLPDGVGEHVGSAVENYFVWHVFRLARP